MRGSRLPWTLLLGIIACTDPMSPLSGAPVDPAELSLTPAAARYQPGLEMAMHVANASDRDYTFHPCGWQLQRYSGERWMPAEGRRICNAVAIRLAPHTAITVTRDLPTGLDDGIYRMAGTFGYADDGQVRNHLQTSSPFEIAD